MTVNGDRINGVRGCRVLIVEDQFLLATDLGRYFSNMGAVVLGPVADVAAAEERVPFADAAVLDIDLNGQSVFPIADQLTRRGVPFVFFTGRSDIAIPLRFRNATHLAKPLDWSGVFDALFPPDKSVAWSQPSNTTVLTVLPKLRLAARLLTEDAGAADRLVELTLEHAIDQVNQKEMDDDLERWLSHLLEKTHSRFRRQILQ